MPTTTKIVTTDSVVPDARLSFWQSQVSSLLTHLECSSCAAHRFSALVKVHQSNPASILEIGAVTHAIARARPKISQIGDEQVFVCIQVDGEAHVEQDGRQCILKPGEITMLDTSRAFQADFPDRMSQWVLQMPRALVRKQIGAVERFTAIAVPKENAVGVVTRDFVGSLVRQFDLLDTSVARRLTEQATEMAMMAFMSSSDDSADDAKAIPAAKSILSHRACVFIEERLRDPALKPTHVADHLGISKRYLNSIFAIHGQSVERFIWDRRIAKCARDLKDPGQRGRAIGDIAFSWGFHSLTHFSQAFKVVHGKSPRDYRKTRD